MNKEIKEKWIAALTSGEYQQAKTSLKLGNNYCCLGVLCDIHRKETKGGKWLVSDSLKIDYIPKGGTKPIGSLKGVLPKEVCDWAGLKEVNPYVASGALASLNDSGQYSFEKLAELIERDL